MILDFAAGDVVDRSGVPEDFGDRTITGMCGMTMVGIDTDAEMMPDMSITSASGAMPTEDEIVF